MRHRCATVLLLWLIGASAFAQFDFGEGSKPVKPKTVADWRREIGRLRTVHQASSLLALIDLMAYHAELAEEAEAAYLEVYDSIRKRLTPGDSPITVRRSLGRWLAEAYQNPKAVPVDLRRVTIRRLVSLKPKTVELSKDYSVFGLFICGVETFHEPNLLNWLVAAEPSYAAELLAQPEFDRKTPLMNALAIKSPSTLRQVVPQLVRDPKAWIRAQAVSYIGVLRVYNPDRLLIRAASDEYAIVRECVPRSLSAATPEVRERIRQKLLDDPVMGVRQAAATDYSMPSFFNAASTSAKA